MAKSRNYNDIIGLIHEQSDLPLKEKYINFILATETSGFDYPYIIVETLKYLTDYCKLPIKTANKLALVRLIYRFNAVNNFITSYSKNIQKTYTFAKERIYYIESLSGSRVATVNEINQGSPGMFTKDKLNIPEDEFKMLSIIMWAMFGRYTYYTNSGYELEKDEQGKIKNDFYSMLLNSSLLLNRAIEFAENKDELLNLIRTIESIEKSGGYKYPQFARDEIQAEIPLSTVIKVLKSSISENTSFGLYKTALDIIEKSKYLGKSKNLTPKQIQVLRTAYEICMKNRQDRGIQLKKSKEKCLKLLEARKSGKIDQNAFVFRIIDTLSSQGYTKLSQAQQRIIDEEYSKISGEVVNRVGTDGIFSEEPSNIGVARFIGEVEKSNELSPLDISNSLGTGIFNSEIADLLGTGDIIEI